MSEIPTAIGLPWAYEALAPVPAPDGLQAIRDASGRVIAVVIPSQEDPEPRQVAALAAFLCQACNSHHALTAACEAVADSFDRTGEFRTYTAEYGIAQIVAMARAAVGQSTGASTDQ